MKNLFNPQMLAPMVAFSAFLSRLKERMFPAAPNWRPAHCGNIKTLLLHLCDMDDELCMWVLRWIAFQMRNPGAKMATGLIVNGKHPGKSLFFEDVLVQLGLRTRVILANELHDHSPTWANERPELVIAYGPYKQQHISRLKALITAEHIVVDRPMYDRPRHMNYVFLSGSVDAITDTGRRFVVVETPPEWPRAFLLAVKEEIDAGGAHALIEYLMRDLDMGNFNENTRPLPRSPDDRRAA